MKSLSVFKPIYFCLCAAVLVLTAGCEKRKDTSTLRLVCLADNPPYTYQSNGGLQGVEIDIARKIAEKTHRKLDIRPIKFEMLLDEIASGGADLAAACIASTAERKKQVAFSLPYEFAGLALVVGKNESARFIEEAEQKNFRFGAQAGDSAWEYLADRMRRAGREGTPNAYQSYNAGIQALLQHKIDAFVLDRSVALCLCASNPEQIKVLEHLLNHEEYAFAVAPGDPELLNAANLVISDMWKSGELRGLTEKHIRQCAPRWRQP